MNKEHRRSLTLPSSARPAGSFGIADSLSAYSEVITDMKTNLPSARRTIEEMELMIRHSSL